VGFHDRHWNSGDGSYITPIESKRNFQDRLKIWLENSEFKIVREGIPKNGDMFVIEATHYEECSEIKTAKIIPIYGYLEDVINFEKDKKYKIVKRWPRKAKVTEQRE